MELVSERLNLKEINLHDLEAIHELHSCSEVDEFNTLGIPVNIEETRRIVEEIMMEQKVEQRKSYQWKIMEKSSNEFIGMAGMFLSADKYRIGEIYYKFFPSQWGKGYATETTKTLIKAGFDVFKLHKVEAGVATENIRSVNVLEKAGMKREGLRRKMLPIRGEWKDSYHYAIVEDDERDY